VHGGGERSDNVGAEGILGAMRRLGLLLAVAVSLGACTTDPEGTRLVLRTAEVQSGPTGCDGAAAAPVRIARDGNELVFVDVGTDQPRSMIWPFGFAAWLEFDRAVLYARDGTVIGREGNVLDTIGGGEVEGEGFHVCSVGTRTYQ
jgi:hypothetical protein